VKNYLSRFIVCVLHNIKRIDRINNCMYVQPKKIVSPISGNIVIPKIITREVEGKIVSEAHYYDPNSGTFLHKGIVSVVDKITKETTTLGNARV